MADGVTSRRLIAFFDNEAIEPAALLAAHSAATVGRMQGQAVVLAIQDPTTLKYSTHCETEGLGPISNNPDKTLGMFVPTTQALSTTGQPPGHSGCGGAGA